MLGDAYDDATFRQPNVLEFFRILVEIFLDGLDCRLLETFLYGGLGSFPAFLEISVSVPLGSAQFFLEISLGAQGSFQIFWEIVHVVGDFFHTFWEIYLVCLGFCCV